MSATRSSSRLSGQNMNSPSQAKSPSNGTKRKADESPSSSSAKAKKGRNTEKEQKTIEETIDGGNQAEEKSQPEDIEMKDAASAGEGDKAEPDTKEQAKVENGAKAANGTRRSDHDDKESCWGWSDNEKYENDPNTYGKTIKAGESWEGKNQDGEDNEDPEKALKNCRGGPGLNALDVDKPSTADKGAPRDEIHAESDTKPKQHTEVAEGGAVEETKERADIQPSNILEKGIIYFFTRGRVGIDDPEKVADLQRSHFVLRPIPAGAKLTDGAIEDLENNRLIALPKKVFPKGPQDKFMAFVEKGKTTLADLKENFFQGSEYATKTVGVRHPPPVTPVAEGVYAITRAGDRDETHLAYMLTIPRDPGEMQEDIGIASKGSFILSLKNPTVKGPSYASLPESADFPKDVIEAFRTRSWMPAEPKHLDYANAQILLIGESFDQSHALDATSKDEKSDKKETPQEELEKLEGEDELRVEHLKGDDTVFDDLGISHKEYPSVPTTW